MNAHKFFNLAIAFVFAFSLLETATPVMAQEPQPNISVWLRPDDDRVLGFHWPVGALLQLDIDDPATLQTPDYTTSRVVAGFNDWEEFKLGGIFEIQPGHLVTVSDGNTTKQHIVTHLTVTNLDMDTDTVSGVANPGSSIYVSTNCDANGCASRNVIADEYGNWLANFAIPVSDPSQGVGVFDLRLASGGSANEDDEDGDNTRISWIVWPPTIGVDVDIDRVQGWDWPLGATVNFEIDDPLTPDNPDYTNAATVHPADWDPDLMYFRFYTNDYDVKPGDIVTATDGNLTKQLIVTRFRITAVDVDVDIVYGIADPGQEVSIWTYDPYNRNEASIGRQVTADQDGNWSANFAIPGDEASEQETIDIRNGLGFDSFVGDEDWDATRSMWQVPNPTMGIRANDDLVDTYIWEMGNTLTLEVDNPNTAGNPDYTVTQTVTGMDPWDPGQTYVLFNLSGVYDVQVGDMVTISNGSITKTTVVSNLAITMVHLDTDTVEGIVEPNQTISVWTCWQSDPCINRDETADENGNWAANFAVPGEQDWEQETADLRAGSWIDSSVNDNDDDSTMFGWYVSDQTPLAPFVVLGQEGVWIKENTDVISGDVAANIASERSYLTDQSEVTIGRDVQFMDPGSRVLGDTVYLKQGSQVYDVYSNDLKGRGTILGTQHTPLELPLVPELPAVPEVTPGTRNFNLKKNAILTLAAGGYGKLETKRGAVITFTGGIYHFTEWNLGDDVKLYFSAPTEIRIAEKLNIGSDAFVGPASGTQLTASDILIHVLGENGKNGKPGASPKSAMFGVRTTLTANVYTPNGTLWIREYSTATGAFFGRWVEIGQNVTLSLDNGW